MFIYSSVVYCNCECGRNWCVSTKMPVWQLSHIAQVHNTLQ